MHSVVLKIFIFLFIFNVKYFGKKYFNENHPLTDPLDFCLFFFDLAE